MENMNRGQLSQVPYFSSPLEKDLLRLRKKGGWEMHQRIIKKEPVS